MGDQKIPATKERARRQTGCQNTTVAKDEALANSSRVRYAHSEKIAAGNKELKLDIYVFNAPNVPEFIDDWL